MKIITIPFLLVISIISNAQISAVTSNGDEVVLYKDGTWKYTSKPDSAKEIKTNPFKFSKKSSSTFEIKSNVIANVSTYINPKAWSFQKSGENSREYEFHFKSGDAYGMLITERIEIPIESLKELALQNAKNAAPDIRLVKEEYRTVNGTKVLLMQMNGTIQGISFTYYGYYFSSKSGTLQLLTYTSENLFHEYQPSLEELLNGLVIKEEK